jgi:hypothetical protein
MNKPGFTDSLFRPSQALDAWMGDPSTRKSMQGGVRWTLTFRLVLGALVSLVGWLASKVIVALVHTLGEKTAISLYQHLPADLVWNGPSSLIQNLVIDVLVALTSILVSTAVVTWYLERSDWKERRIQVFNVLTYATLPWSALAILPVLGWVLAIVGVLINGWRAMGALFPDQDRASKLVGLVLGALAGILTASAIKFVVASALNLAFAAFN